MHSRIDRPDRPADDLKAEIKRLFTTFLPNRAARFSELLDLDPRRWSKIDPWAAWDVEECGRVVAWPRGLKFAEAHQWPAMACVAKTHVVVLRCGHSEPSLTREPLHGLFRGERFVLDGFVSITPGSLGLALNHSGDVKVLSTRPLAPWPG
jgi:hypothetical protein